MARISEEDITRVREATDIVSVVEEYLELRPRGRDLWANCPFHHEKTPSFKVSPQSQTWHCFGCGEGGDVFKFVMMREQFDFPEAVRYLADRANISITEVDTGMPKGHRAKLLAACDEAASFYHTQLMRGRSEGSGNARSYLGSRGFGGNIPTKWNLGYAPGRSSLVAHLRSKGFSNKEMIDANLAMTGGKGGLRDRFYDRVMFPIRDIQGRTIAFGGRVVGKGEPKYINTSNCPLFSKRSNLFGIDYAKGPIVTKGITIVVEGYTDVIAMHESGFNNTVATLGTALTPQHVKLLTRFASKIIYLFDGDAAGQKAADRAAELITTAVAPEAGRQLALNVAVIPNNMDPVEFIEARGVDEMSKLLDSSEPLLRFVIDRRIANSDMSTPESRAIALPKVLEPLIPIRDSILSDEYVNYIADMFRIDFSKVRRQLDTAKMPRPAREYSDDAFYAGEPASYAGKSAPRTGGSASYARGSVPYETDRAEEAVEASIPNVPSYVLPLEGAGRWEVQLLALYAIQPQVRTRISVGMRDRNWQLLLHAQVMSLMESMDPASSTSAVVGKCMLEIPESEPIWALDIPGSEDPVQAEMQVDIMIRERDKSIIEDQIRSLENSIKHDRSLGVEQRNAAFEQISALQKQLALLRQS